MRADREHNTQSNDVGGKKDNKDERGCRLRADAAKLDKIRSKSMIAGGHNLEGHSPVYE